MSILREGGQIGRTFGWQCCGDECDGDCRASRWVCAVQGFDGVDWVRYTFKDFHQQWTGYAADRLNLTTTCIHCGEWQHTARKDRESGPYHLLHARRAVRHTVGCALVKAATESTG